MSKFLYYLITVLFIISLPLRTMGQANNSYPRIMDSLLVLYQQAKLNDTNYMNAVKALAVQGYGHEDFAKKLQPFYRIAFKDGKPNEYRVAYYVLLTLNAHATRKTGRSLYFLEKEITEKKKLHKEYAGNFVLAYYQIGIYRNAGAYEKCMATYNDIGPELGRIPENIRRGNLDKQSVSDALAIIAAMMPVYGITQDSNKLRDLFTLANRIYHATVEQKGIYAPFDKEYQYYYHNVCYGQHIFANGFGTLAIQDLKAMQKALLAQDYPSKRPVKYLLSELYFRFSQCYIKLRKTDSARYYMEQQRLLNLDNDVAAQPVTKQDYLENMSEILAMEHRYEAAYKNLKEAYALQDTLLQEVMTDRDNNLYAEALAEDRQLALDEANEHKKQSEAFNRMLLGAILLLLLLSSLLMVWTKWQQKKKYLEFKLNMARNLHDETGPALLYAKALAKKEAESSHNNNYTVLEHHIGHTMEVIRSLTHDLKSNQQHTMASLIWELKGTLEKLGSMTGFEYDIKRNNSSRSFISHFQYTQLKAILHECISNSIKHAEFKYIHITFSRQRNRLHITYNDNGQGMNPEKMEQGIGIENIKERVQKLGGLLTIDNHFPYGYNISLDIPLL